MFRKLLLSTLAALGLMTAVAVPATQAYPHYRHEPVRREHYGHEHFRAWNQRGFRTYAEANAWLVYQRQCGFECYIQWQGPQCCVFYR